MLITRIERFLRETGMPWTKFGRLAAHDPRFVQDLRNGRTPRDATAKRVEHFMNIYREGTYPLATSRSECYAREMGNLNKLPWWIAFPFSIGSGLMGAFATSAIPQWVQMGLFGLGAILFAIGLVSMCWHFGLNRWFARHVTWRFRLHAPSHNAIIANPRIQLSPTNQQPEQWVPLHKALHHLVYRSDWAWRQDTPSSELDFNRIVATEFQERLARGELRARGAKAGIDFADSGQPTEEIPSSYWNSGFLSGPHALVALSDPKNDAAGIPYEKHTYRRVIVNRDDLYAVWPEFPGTEFTPLAAFVEPLRKQFEQEQQRGKVAKLADFGLPYPKAVLKAEISQPKGTLEARAGQPPHRMSIVMTVRNDFTKPLPECVVVLTEFEQDGIRSPFGEVLKGGEDRLTIRPNSPFNFQLISRDISDQVTPAPFLVRLQGRDLPLKEQSTYILVFELRCRYPLPTIVTVRLETGTGLDAEANVVNMRLANDEATNGN